MASSGDFKRTLTPTKKLDPKDIQKTEAEIGEIFALFKAFVGRHRPQLDIDAVATGETWFGEDAVECAARALSPPRLLRRV